MAGHKEDSLNPARYSLAPLGSNKISDLTVYLHAERNYRRSNKFHHPAEEQEEQEEEGKEEEIAL